MTYEIYDSWDNHVVRKGLSYREVQDWLQVEEPPRTHNGLLRYYYWPERRWQPDALTFQRF